MLMLDDNTSTVGLHHLYGLRPPKILLVEQRDRVGEEKWEKKN